MVEALSNLQEVYAKWQSRNPYLQAGQPCGKSNSFYARDGDGDSYRTGQKSWYANVGSSLRPPPRHRVAKQRGRSRRENGLTDADELMVSYRCCLCTTL